MTDALSVTDAVIPFCEDWTDRDLDGASEEVQELEVAREIARLQADGAPVLRAILACAHDVPLNVGLRILTRGPQVAPGDELPADLRQVRSVFLRLVAPDALTWTDPETGTEYPGRAVPPDRDANGLLLPPADRGRNLVAKVGNLGGDLPPGTDPKRAQKYGADFRAKAAGRRPLYRTVTITRDPAEYSPEDALVVLRQWGYGVGERVFRSAEGRKAGKVPQCVWLVEEVSEEAYFAHRARAPQGKASGKASGKSVGEVGGKAGATSGQVPAGD